MKLRPENLTDFYKTGHIRQYPPGTEFVYSNWTCRDDKHFNKTEGYDHKAVFFGLQGVAQELLVETWNRDFFNVPRSEIEARITKRMDGALGPKAVSPEALLKLHDLGYLPLLIKAVPEGSRVNIRVPMFTIQNTHPDFYWLTNYVESQLSAELHKMITTASTAYEYRRMLDAYAKKTGSALDFVPWQGHDFSFRGMSGIHDAVTSGAAHLLSFTGTDTIPAIDYLEEYYNGGDTFVGGSVPATEHSVMCMGGEEEEIDTFRRLITKTYPEGVVSIVSDTWDFWKVLSEYTVTLKDEILNRPGKVVFRPDSGNPADIICGDPDAVLGTPAAKGAVEQLWEVFGGTVTSTGYKMLDAHVGLIYGDSITLEIAEEILRRLEEKGFASGNIVFGIGSFTYQYVTRDTFGCAIKATFGTVNGVDRELSKTPKTDSGMKKSAKGLVRVEKEGNDFVLYEQQTREQEQQGVLTPVFVNGKVVRKETLAEIRHRLLTGA